MIITCLVIYMAIGPLFLVADSLSIQAELPVVYTNTATFLLGVMLWPLVFVWARYKWNKNTKG